MNWKCYIAGPMTGLPQFNFPAFFEAAERLRANGWEVVSPAEIDEPETKAAALASPAGAPGTGAANGETWGDFLARDVKLIADDGIEFIFVLPGWEKSRGARLETFVGQRLCGLHVVDYTTGKHVSDAALVAATGLDFMGLPLAAGAEPMPSSRSRISV